MEKVALKTDFSSRFTVFPSISFQHASILSYLGKNNRPVGGHSSET
jgi:hypothetical protein